MTKIARNNKPNFKKGARRKIVYLLLLNGALSYKSLSLLKENKETAYRKLIDMEKEGLIVKNKYQDTWLITFKAFTEELENTLSSYFPKELIDIYKSYGRESARKAKYNFKNTKLKKDVNIIEEKEILSSPEPTNEWGFEEYLPSSYDDVSLDDLEDLDTDTFITPALSKKELLIKKNRMIRAKRSAMRRVVRNAETLMFVDRLPVSYEVDKKPSLLSNDDTSLLNYFYTPYEVNTSALSYKENNRSYKFRGARHNGLMITAGGSYVFYNSSKWGMQVNKGYEQILVSFIDSILQNHNLSYLEGAIRLYSNDRLALSIMEKKSLKIGSYKESNNPEWVTNIEDHFNHVYMLPLDNIGQELVKIMCTNSWKEKMTKAFFVGLKEGHKNCKIELHLENIKHKHNDGYMLYYNDLKGSYVHHRAVTLHYFIPDVKKLRYFIESIVRNGNTKDDGTFEADEVYEIYCFDFQYASLKAFVGSHAIIKKLSFKRFLDEYYK